MSQNTCKCERSIPPAVMEGYACGNKDCWRTPIVQAEFDAFVADLVRRRGDGPEAAKTDPR